MPAPADMATDVPDRAHTTAAELYNTNSPPRYLPRTPPAPRCTPSSSAPDVPRSNTQSARSPRSSPPPPPPSQRPGRPCETPLLSPDWDAPLPPVAQTY